MDVVCRLHEAQRHEIDAELEAEPQVVVVLVSDGGSRQCDAGRVDALVRAQYAAVDDHRLQLLVFRRGHPQLDPPIVEQEPVAWLC